MAVGGRLTTSAPAPVLICPTHKNKSSVFITLIFSPFGPKITQEREILIFRVDEIYDEAKKIFGACSDEKLFRWLGDAAALIANKADLDGLRGYLDVCTVGCSCQTTQGSICN